jgi:cytosine/creatinine deaminase
MATVRSAELFGLEDYGLREGCWADLVVLEAGSVEEAVLRQPEKRYVLKRGEIIAMNECREHLFV